MPTTAAVLREKCSITGQERTPVVLAIVEGSTRDIQYKTYPIRDGLDIQKYLNLTRRKTISTFDERAKYYLKNQCQFLIKQPCREIKIQFIF